MPKVPEKVIPTLTEKEIEKLLAQPDKSSNEGNGLTRLVSRWAFEYKPRLLNKMAYNWLLEPIAAVMQRKMLLSIKNRAEMATNR